MALILEEITDWEELRQRTRSQLDEIHREVQEMFESLQKESEMMVMMAAQIEILEEYVRSAREREMEAKRDVERLMVAVDEELRWIEQDPINDRRRA